MYIRTYESSDLSNLINLTVETFRPYFEDFIHPLLGDDLFQHQQGSWVQDYHDEIPTLHDPQNQRFVAVGVVDSEIVGYVAWRIDDGRHHGEIDLLAVASSARRQQNGLNLCRHAVEQMKANGVEAVEIGTGDDEFHAAARGLYEELGFIKIPTANYLMAI
jgi:ribosomal protein S18 acetylase RimI-like enzyme